MAGCKDCYNGCVETTSDACVKYTGTPYPTLEIATGDSLKIVEVSIIEHLLTALNGTGIVMAIDNDALCALVSGYLPVSGDITIVHYVTALIKSACDLQTQITSVTVDIDEIEADYVVGCLTGVLPGAGTHSIVQAVITKLCTVSSDLGALATDLSTNYVRKDQINDYIQEYLDEIEVTTLMKNKMVPYTVVEYYGSPAVFDLSGAGTGDWVEIYLCNGNNNTPDKRGRSPIGATTGMGGEALSPVVDPGVSPANPNYTLLSTRGSNEVVLNATQVPNHTHSATVNDPGHFHNQTGKVDPGSSEGSNGNDNPVNGSYPTTTKTTGITVDIAPTTGGGLGHANIHPVIACYYIMYIPNP